jgi:transcription elongation GreA/GreB family factor
VVPGSRVRYRRHDTGAEREIVVATGDGDPPGALSLASPIVRALHGAEVGETVTLEIGESTVDLEVLEITPPT